MRTKAKKSSLNLKQFVKMLRDSGACDQGMRAFLSKSGSPIQRARKMAEVARRRGVDYYGCPDAMALEWFSGRYWLHAQCGFRVVRLSSIGYRDGTHYAVEET